MTTPRCWNCGADTQGRAFCPSCGKIASRPPDATHFDVFGLQREFDVDVSLIEQHHRELSLKLHPDRFAQADPRERRLSLEHTTALNEALKTLKDPVRRAFYLLRLHGVDLEREGAPENRRIPAEFLEEVMELREALHEAREAKDVEGAQRMGAEVQAKLGAALGEAAAALKRAGTGPDADTAVKEAAQQLARVRYYQRFLEEVSAIEEEALA